MIGSGIHIAFYLVDSLAFPWSKVARGVKPTTQVKNAWNYNSSPPYVLMAWRLIEHREFIFYLIKYIRIICHCFQQGSSLILPTVL